MPRSDMSNTTSPYHYTLQTLHFPAIRPVNPELANTLVWSNLGISIIIIYLTLVILKETHKKMEQSINTPFCYNLN